MGITLQCLKLHFHSLNYIIPGILMVLAECSYNALLYKIQWNISSFIHFTLILLCLSFTYWEKFPGMKCLCVECSTPWTLRSNGMWEGPVVFHLVFSCANKRHFSFLSEPRLKPTKMQGYSNRIAEVLKTKLGGSDVVHLNTKHCVCGGGGGGGSVPGSALK